MRIVVVGAGAIGGFLAARLVEAGHEVAIVARGAHLAAIRAAGALRLEAEGEAPFRAPVEALADLGAAGPRDAVIVTLKAHQLPAMAEPLAAAIARADLAIPIQNGVPWWYFGGLDGPHRARPIEAVDPGGRLLRAIDGARLTPCFAFKSAEVVSPGVVRHIPSTTDLFPLGPADPAAEPRARRAAALLGAAGLDAPLSDIRTIVWRKLLGNVFANPVGALTGGTVGEIVHYPATRALCLALMHEVGAVATALGCPHGIDPEARLARAAAVGAAKSSMLQDRERGRPLEIGAILGALVEIAGWVGVPTPHAATLNACLSLAEARRLGAAA